MWMFAKISSSISFPEFDADFGKGWGFPDFAFLFATLTEAILNHYEGDDDGVVEEATEVMQTGRERDEWIVQG